jgi:hypothetical protein
MRVVRCLLMVLGMLIMAPVWAYDGEGAEGLLNKVTLSLTAEQYVATKTALVTIGINAGVNDAALQTIQEDIIKKLDGLSNKGEWHIISFDRSLDQSGLEKVQIEAQARLPSSALPNLRDKAKSMSKPGETYTLDNVEFTPSADELKDANITLRGVIYQQAKDELDRLNKAYPDQKYYVHNIDFLNNANTPRMMPPMPMPMHMMMATNTNVKENTATVAVGDKLVLTAAVVLATAPDQSLIKMIH